MKQSGASKNALHPLTKIADAYVADVYLILLMSVAESSAQFDEAEDNSLSYVCRIAAALTETPDMQEILRRSLILDEKALNDYAVTLKQHDLQNFFMFDALTMVSLYSKDSSSIAEYIMGLANILRIDNNSLQEISTVVKSVLGRQSNFKYKFENITCYEFLPYIRQSCKNVFIEASDMIFSDFEETTDITTFINSPIECTAMKLVHFRNSYFHDKKVSFRIKETKTAEFIDCRFEKVAEEKLFEFETKGDLYTFPDEIRLFACENIGTLKIVGCKFFDIINNLIDYRNTPEFYGTRYWGRGILIWVQNIDDFTLKNCEFTNCYFRQILAKGLHCYLYYRQRMQLEKNEYIERKFKPGNFTLDEFKAEAWVCLNRNELSGDWLPVDSLLGGGKVKHDDISDNKVINSYEVF